MSEEIDEWKKLSTYDQVQHANWKCRKMGYESLQKELAKSMEGEPIFKKYSVLVKKFVTEQNELSRMVSSELAVSVIEGCTTKDAAKVASGAIDGVIAKCFNSKPGPKTKLNGMELCLQFVEHERAEDVMNALFEGAGNKQPKIAAASIETLKQCLEAFGHKVITLKGAFATLPKLFHHRDKLVRGAVRDFFVEAHAWIGPIVKQQLEKEAKIEHCIKECEEAWADQKAKSKQKRFFKSQTEQRAKAEAAAAGGEEEEEDEEEEAEQVDAFELLPETPLLPLLAKKFKFEDEEKSFYEFIESKKWKERGAALDSLNKQLGMDTTKLPDSLENMPLLKLAPGDYTPLAKSLTTCIKKDTNVLLLIKAFTALAALSVGLREKFKNYGTLATAECLSRFKEKKVTVVNAGRMAVDAVSKTIKFPDQVIEPLSEKLGDKNPAIRSETTLMMMRNLKPKSAVMGKATLKELMPKLIANLEHSDKTVRESTYKCLAVIKTKVGEKTMNVFTADLKDDKKKLIEDAVTELKGAPPPEKAKKPDSPKKVEKKEEPKKVEKKAAKKAPAKKAKKVEKVETTGPPKEAEMGEEVAVDKCSELFGETTVKEIQNSAWKARLEHLQIMNNKCNILGDELPAQAVLRVLSLKPGFKDTNFQCNQEKFKIIAHCGKTATFSETSFNIVVDYCLEKLADPKCGALAQEALNSMAEYLSLPFVIAKVLPIGEKLKNVKNVAEMWTWVASALPLFGFGKLDVGLFTETTKKALGHTNAKVRQGAIEAIASVMRFLPQLKNFYSGEKDAVQKQIDEAYAKFSGQGAPVPTRGPAIRAASSKAQDEEAPDVEEEEEEDLMPRTDISSKIDEALINRIGDSNWKERRDALAEVKTLFEQNKFVTPELGHLPAALAKRLGDVNKVLLATVIEIWILVAASLGPKGAKKHVKTAVVPLIGVMADAKVQLREKAAAALSSWLELVPMKLWFDDEAISETLADAKKVHLRATFLPWLGEKLKEQKKVPKAGLEPCLKHVYAAMEDRDGKVRAGASAVLPGLMIHLGYAKMAKEAPATKQKIRDELDKVKEALPKPEVAPVVAEVIDAEAVMAQATGTKKKKKEAPKEQEEPEEKMEEEKPKVKKKTAAKPKTVKGKVVVEEELGDIIIGTAKQKTVRDKEDTKLKSLKWTFDAGTAPREELLEQLKNQCASCFGDKFNAFFHKTDGPSQTKALALLEKEPVDKLTLVMDLILRWMTVRFGEKNTTVLTKCLSWLVTLFEQLNAADYRMPAFEAYAFLPHLISKLGESRQEVRDQVHQLLRQMVFFYSNVKIFEELLAGAKSKNSRTRTECLKHCGEMIAKHGESVWGTPKQGALKELAAQISDRDQNVRSAALNALVEVHRLIGEQVFNPKKIGRLGEKEESYLKERIKRASSGMEETKVVSKRQTMAGNASRRGTFTVNKKDQKPIKRDEPIKEEQVVSPEPAAPPEPECRFKLVEPPASDVQVKTLAELNLIEHKNLDELLEEPKPIQYKYKERMSKLTDQEKIERAERELDREVNCEVAPEILVDICAQLESNQPQRIVVGLGALNAMIKRPQRIDGIGVKIGTMVDSLCQVYDATVAEMLLNEEDSAPIVKIIWHVAVVLGHAFTHFKDHFDASAVSQITESAIRLLTKKSFLARCQSVEPRLAPLIQNMLQLMAQRVPLSKNLLGLARSSFTYIENLDEVTVKAFVRMYYKAISQIDTPNQQWSVDDFEKIVNTLSQYVEKYPKSDPIYSSKSKLDILRCHVTLCNNFTVKYPDLAQAVLDKNRANNTIYERIRRQLSSVRTSEEKENEVHDPLRLELSKLLRDCGDSSKSNAIKKLYAFTKRNPDYSIEAHFEINESKYTKYFKLFITRRLDQLRFNEENNKPEPAEKVAQDLTVEQHMERIAVMRENLGMEPLVTKDSQVTVVTKPEETIVPQPLAPKVEQLEPASPVKPVEPKEPAAEKRNRISQSEMEKLRARLNMLRK